MSYMKHISHSYIQQRESIYTRSQTNNASCSRTESISPENPKKALVSPRLAGPSSKKLKFTKAEDQKLFFLVQEYGDNDWKVIADHLVPRTPRQCRERWTNYVNPKLSKETWSQEEDILLFEKHCEFGNHWKVIEKYFINRSKNNIKHRWAVIKAMGGIPQGALQQHYQQQQAQIQQQQSFQPQQNIKYDQQQQQQYNGNQPLPLPLPQPQLQQQQILQQQLQQQIQQQYNNIPQFPYQQIAQPQLAVENSQIYNCTKKGTLPKANIKYNCNSYKLPSLNSSPMSSIIMPNININGNTNVQPLQSSTSPYLMNNQNNINSAVFSNLSASTPILDGPSLSDVNILSGITIDSSSDNYYYLENEEKASLTTSPEEMNLNMDINDVTVFEEGVQSSFQFFDRILDQHEVYVNEIDKMDVWTVPEENYF